MTVGGTSAIENISRHDAVEYGDRSEFFNSQSRRPREFSIIDIPELRSHRKAARPRGMCSMKGSFEVGIREGLIDQKHFEAMGHSIWLYLWVIRRNTDRRGGGKFVWGGKPTTYAEISKDSGFPVRRVRFWLDRLRKFGYVFVHHTNYSKMRIEINKAKKFKNRKGKTGNLFAEIPVDKSVEMSEKRPDQLTQNCQLKVPKSVNLKSQNCQLNKSHSIEPEARPPVVSFSDSEIPLAADALTAKTAAAFRCIGFEEPFGQPEFQAVWVKNHDREDPWLTIKMEATIQECQRKKIGVPPQFYFAKHDVEKTENAMVKARPM